MKVEQAKMNLLQKAKARPDQVRKVMEVARNMGWKSALEKVRNRLESPSPLGYSAAGIVVAVDEGNGRFRVGDRVACGVIAMKAPGAPGSTGTTGTTGTTGVGAARRLGVNAVDSPRKSARRRAKRLMLMSGGACVE